MVLKYLLEKEVKQFLRNPIFPRIVMMFPVIVLLVMPWATSFEVENVNVVVVDADNTVMSQRLTHKIDGSRYFNLVGTTASYWQALAMVESHEADLVLEIPDGFEKTLIHEGNAEFQVSANSVNGSRGSLGANYMNMLVGDFSTEIAVENGRDVVKPVDVIVRNLYNELLDYKKFMVPALIVIVLIILCGFLPALNIVNEKEIGTISQINVTPVGRWTFIFAKLLPYWVIGMLAISIGFTVAWLVYGLVPKGSFVTIYLAAAIFILVVSSLGLIVSNYSATMQQAMFLMMFIMIIFILMSGLFTPIASMPEWAQWVAFFNPPHYVIDILRSVYLKGGTMASNAFEFAMLGAFAIVTSLLAILSYRKRE